MRVHVGGRGAADERTLGQGMWCRAVGMLQTPAPSASRTSPPPLPCPWPGGHLNPAVTVATLTTGHTSASRALAYIAAQVAGSICASAMHVRRGLRMLAGGGDFSTAVPQRLRRRSGARAGTAPPKGGTAAWHGNLAHCASHCYCPLELLPSQPGSCSWCPRRPPSAALAPWVAPASARPLAGSCS